MSRFVYFLVPSLKAFTCFWALVTMAVAAATQAKLNDIYGTDYVNDTNLAAGNAIIATGVLTMIYLAVALTLLFLTPSSILISVMVDTICLGFLFILSLGSTAAESTEASDFSNCSGYDVCDLGSATIGLAWVLTFLLLAILLLEVIYTVIHYGRSWPTWRTPIHQLLEYGTPSTTTRPGAGVDLVGGQAEQGVAMGSVGPTVTPFPPSTGQNSQPTQMTQQQSVQPMNQGYPHSAVTPTQEYTQSSPTQPTLTDQQSTPPSLGPNAFPTPQPTGLPAGNEKAAYAAAQDQVAGRALPQPPVTE